MNYKDQIDRDLKTALLAGEKDTAVVLRGLKSAILYVEVAKGSRAEGLPETDILVVLSKEAKKRQESADLFKQGGHEDRAATELAEKTIIERYLPKQLDEAEIRGLIDAIAVENGAVSKETMGTTIAAVKARSGGAVDGALVARLVKARIDASGGQPAGSEDIR